MIDFLVYVLFESWPWLLVVCAMAMAVTIGIHRSRGTVGSWRAIWVTLAVCAGLLLMQYLVETPREAIERTLRTIGRAVQEGEIGTIGEYVAPDMGWRDGRRQAFIESATLTLQDYAVSNLKIYSVVPEVQGDAATVTFWCRCSVRYGGNFHEGFHSLWQLHLVRRDGRWLIDRVIRGEAKAAPLPAASSIDLLSYFR